MFEAERLEAFQAPIEVRGGNDPVEKDLDDGIREAYEECDGLLRALNYKSNAEDDYYYGEEEEDFI